MTEQVAPDDLAASATSAEPSLARRAGLGMVWGQVAKTLEVGLTFAIAVVAVRALDPNAFGLYSLLTYLAGGASIFIPIVTTESLGAVLPRFADRSERLFVFLLLAALRAGVIMAAVVALLPAWSALRAHLGLAPVSSLVFLLAGGYWLAQDFLNTVAGYYLTELDLRPVAVWKPIGQLATLAALGFAVARGTGAAVGTVLVAVAGGYVLSGIVLALRLRAHGKPRRPPGERIRLVLSFTRNTWLIGMLGFVLATQIDVVLIGAITHNSREAAFYVVAVGIVGRAQFLLLSGWASPIIPSLGEARVRGGIDGLARAWRLFAELWMFIALPINALLLVTAHPLVKTVFGSSYAPAGGLLVWMSALNLIVALVGGQLPVSALWALDRQGPVVRVRLVTAALNLGLAVPLIAEYKALGAVLATGAAAVATTAAELALARRYGRVGYPAAFVLRVSAATALAVVPALLIGAEGTVGLVASLVLGVAVFLAAAAVIRPFSPDDLEALGRVSPRLAASPLRMLAGRGS